MEHLQSEEPFSSDPYFSNILSGNSCHLVNLFSFASSSFFLNSQQPKMRGHIEHHTPLWLPESKGQFLEYLGYITLVQPYDVDALPRLVNPTFVELFVNSSFFPFRKVR